MINQADFETDWNKWIIIAFALVVMLVVIGACDPQKQLNKSYQRVIADSTQMAKIRAVVERIWPCVPAVAKPGQVIRVVEKVIDTAQVNAYNKKLDSLLNSKTILPNTNIDSLTKAIKLQLADQFKPIVITNTDTRIDTVPDLRAIQLMQERIDMGKQGLFTAQGQLVEKDKQIATLEKQSLNRLAIIIAILSFFVLILGISIYFKYFTASGSIKSIINKL